MPRDRLLDLAALRSTVNPDSVVARLCEELEAARADADGLRDVAREAFARMKTAEREARTTFADIGEQMEAMVVALIPPDGSAPASDLPPNAAQILGLMFFGALRFHGDKAPNNISYPMVADVDGIATRIVVTVQRPEGKALSDLLADARAALDAAHARIEALADQCTAALCDRDTNAAERDAARSDLATLTVDLARADKAGNVWQAAAVHHSAEAERLKERCAKLEVACRAFVAVDDEMGQRMEDSCDVHADEDPDWGALAAASGLARDALAEPETTAPPATHCPGCAKVARHPGERYECFAHPATVTSP